MSALFPKGRSQDVNILTGNVQVFNIHPWNVEEQLPYIKQAISQFDKSLKIKKLDSLGRRIYRGEG